MEVAGSEEFLGECFPQYAGMPAKKVIKRVSFGKFGGKIIAFDPSQKRAVDATNFFVAK